MQISGFSIPTSIPMEKNTTSPTPKVATDQAVINFSPVSFSGLVREASQMPEVRSDLVESFRAKIQSGQYPTDETLSGLVDTIGASIVRQANSGSSGQ